MLNQISDGRRCRRTHSSEFKAHVVASCRYSDLSIAAVAMANGVNANLARRWVIEAARCAIGDARLRGRASGVDQTPAFVAVQLPCAQPAPDIRIQLSRGATAITAHWPRAEAAQCGAWMRELLR